MMNTTDVTFKQISFARKILQFSQEEVAVKLGLTKLGYNKIENGKVDPKLSNFRKIISFFEEQGVVFHEDGNVTLKRSEKKLHSDTE